MSTRYVAGQEYCVFTITKRKAEQCGISDPEQVIIKKTEHGISIENKNATSLEHSQHGHARSSLDKDDLYGTIK